MKRRLKTDEISHPVSQRVTKGNLIAVRNAKRKDAK
jgi:hypothetical protein